MTTEPPQPGSLDALDHAVLRALHRDPRAPFSEVAATAGVHERTAARRLDRMTATGAVGFTATLVPEYLGEGVTAEAAVRCAPGRVHDTALALARRPETRSVEVATGALDVFAELNVPDHDALLTLVDAGIGRLDGVVDIHSSVVLRLLLTASDWAPYDDEPTDVRRRRHRGPEPARAPGGGRAGPAPGRAPAPRRPDVHHPAGPRAPGRRDHRASPAGRLMASHVLHLRLHAEPEVLGYPVEARFRLAVDHARLDAAIRRLAEEPAVRHLVVTTGTTALLGYSSHRSTRDLHDFTARVFGALDGVTSTEVAVLMRTYKRAGFASR